MFADNYLLDDIGEFIVEYKDNEVEQKIAGEFLTDFIMKLHYEDKKNYEKIKGYALAQCETNCYDPIEAILAKESFEREYKIQRIGKTRGRLDCIIREQKHNDYVFAMELKQCHKGYNGKKNILEKISFSEKFNKAMEQIEKMKIDKYPYFCSNIKGRIGIALIFIVFYCSSKYPEIIDEEIGKLDTARIIIRFNTDLIKDFDFKSLLLLDKEIVRSKRYREPKNDAIYAGFCSVAKVYPLKMTGL